MMRSAAKSFWDLEENPRLLRALFVAVLLLALIPRIISLVNRGALWGDEAALAMNIVHRGFSELGRPFVYEQVAPWGAMAGMKISTLILGPNEIGLRAFSLFSSMVAVAACYFVGKRLAGPWVGLLTMLFLAVSLWMNYYSVEAKPYAVDAAVTAVLYVLTLRSLDKPHDLRRLITLGVIGVGAAWMSLPAVFVLASGGAVLLIALLADRRGFASLSVLGVAGVAWLVSFWFHFQMLVVKSGVAEDKGAVEYWNKAFAPFPPTTVEHFRWYVGKFFYVFENPGGLGSRYLLGLAFLVGLYLVARRSRAVAALLVLPGIAALVTSMFERYPMLERLLLFFMPSIMLLIAVCFVRLIQSRSWILKGLGAVLLVAALVPKLPATVRSIPTSRAPDVRELMLELGKRKAPGDIVFLGGGGLATVFDFYAPLAGMNRDYCGVESLRNYEEPGYYPQLPELATLTAGYPRTWLILSNFYEGKVPEGLRRSGEPYATFVTRYLEKCGGVQLDRVEATDAVLFLYDMSNAKMPPGEERFRNRRPQDD